MTSRRTEKENDGTEICPSQYELMIAQDHAQHKRVKVTIRMSTLVHAATLVTRCRIPTPSLATGARLGQNVLPALQGVTNRVREEKMLDLMSNLVDVHDWRYEAWLPEFRSPHVAAAAEALPLRRDVVTLLQFTQEQKVVGTKSSGNMPLKMIRLLTPHFVDPPVLDEEIGDRVFALRSEYDVWPLYFRHVLAELGGLLTTPQGARWRVTPEGEAWLAADSATQTLHLLYTWWFGVNWLITWPLTGFGEYLPQGFEEKTLARLLAIPVGRRVDFPTFADTLVQRTGVTWTALELPDHAGWLRSAMRKIVAQPGEDLGILELETQEIDPSPLQPKLLAFRVTPLGRVLLTALTFPPRQRA
jgi:hypothetical protein